MTSVIDISTNKKYTCFDFVMGNDGIIYGVCGFEDEMIQLIPYDRLKVAVSNRKLFEDFKKEN